MPDSLLLAAAFLSTVAGMGWLALAMDVHWRQVFQTVPKASRKKGLRVLGGAALVTALALCLSVDHASMASLVWVMCLGAAALMVAFTLTTKPRLLVVLTPWYAIAK